MKKWINIGRKLVLAGQIEEALDTFRRILREDPSNFEVINEIKTLIDMKYEAERYPGGWVYVCKGNYGPNDPVPKEAISGAWKVNNEGVIVGEFIPNNNFKTLH